jgi:hypothetical protein
MAEQDVLSNQKLILDNQASILANQETIKNNQAAILANQDTIKNNQQSLDLILRNQEKILALLQK